MKKLIFYTLALSSILIGCGKSSSKEPFSKKLAITFSYTDLTGNYVNQSTSNAFSVESGKSVTVNIGIGGEEGFGSQLVKDAVQSLEITTVTPRGTTTCTAIPRAMLIGATNWGIPIRETITVTYTLTSPSGETSVQGPFTITAVDNQLTFSGESEFFNTSFFTMSYGNLATPYAYYSQFSYDNNDPLEVKYPVLGAATINAKKCLVIPSKFTQFNVAPNIVSQYNCGWNATKIMPYTGTMDLSENVLSNTYTYADLNALSVTSSQDTLSVTPGAKFVFETPEGKKGLGKFFITQPTNNVRFVFQCQK